MRSSRSSSIVVDRGGSRTGIVRRNAARSGTPLPRGRSGGTSFATGRPCSVITTSRPFLTSSRSAERFWRASLPLLALALLLALAPGADAQPKDTLTVALISHAPTLDPHMHFERVGILVNINMFDSLLHKNARLEYEPSLATSWKALNDTTWEFKLRKGVKFHNGDTMTAEDVKFSFERVTEPGKEKKKSPQYGNIRAIKDVRIVDAETIHLVTDKPFPLLLERLVFFPIVPKKHLEKVGDDAFGTTAAVGTGPWKFVEWKRDQYIRLEAFDGHWRGKPAFKHLVIRAVPEVATQIAEMKTGGVDIIRNVPPDLVPELNAGPLTHLSSTPILRAHYVELRPVFEAITQMLTEVGLRTNARMWDPGPAWNKFLQTEGKASNAAYGSWGNYSVFDADAVLHPLFHTEPGGWIGKHYTRVEGLDKLIDEGRSTLNQAARKRTYSQIQKLIREEAPAIYLFTQYDTLAISKRVEYAARGDEWLWLFDAKPKR